MATQGRLVGSRFLQRIGGCVFGDLWLPRAVLLPRHLHASQGSLALPDVDNARRTSDPGQHGVRVWSSKSNFLTFPLVVQRARSGARSRPSAL